ncbi:MAG TPA: LPS export ABC transporter permease LptG [Bacteroidota bacterium]
MKLIDRYVIRQFIVSFLFGLVAFLLIFVLVDAMEHIDDFIDAHAPVKVIVEYYIAFLPEIIKLMTPVAVLLGSLFVIGRLSTNSELTAMKSSGVSLYRILLPFLAVAFIISFASVYLNGWVVPRANAKKYYIERTVLNRGTDISTRMNIFFQEGPRRVVSMNYFDPLTNIASHVSIQDFADSDMTVLARRFDAPKMKWVDTSASHGGPVTAGWILQNGATREFDGSTQHISFFDSQPVGRLGLTPSDIEKKQRKPDEMDYNELKEFINNQELAGQDVSRWLVDFHSKVSFPFASVIMVLFGVPFASARPRSGIALGFGICTAVTFIYLAFMKVSQVIGYNGDVDPLLTAWLANLIFLAAGVVNMIRVQK